MMPVQWAVWKDFVRVSVAIIDEKGFAAPRKNEVDTILGELRGVSPELQSIR